MLSIEKEDIRFKEQICSKSLHFAQIICYFFSRRYFKRSAWNVTLSRPHYDSYQQFSQASVYVTITSMSRRFNFKRKQMLWHPYPYIFKHLRLLVSQPFLESLEKV